MADNFADFYTGAMAPPDRMPDGSLKPAMTPQQMSIADMYKGILPPNGAPEGLSTRSVTTRGIVIGPNGFPVAQTKAEPAAPNGTGYQSGYVKTNNDRLPTGTAPALAAIDTVAPRRNLFAESGYVAQPRFASSLGAMYGGNDPGDGGLFGIPMSQGMADIIATDPKYAQQRTVKYAAPAPAPAPAPAAPAGGGSLLSTLASMFASSPQTITEQGGGGAYIPSSGSFAESIIGSGGLAPAAMNNPRWW